MIKRFLTAFLTVALCTTSYAAVTNAGANAVMMTATADLVTNQLPYGATVKYIKIHPGAANKTYTLRAGTISGTVLYRTGSQSTTAPLGMDTVRITKPSAGIYLQTDDSSPTLFLYTE